MKILLEYDPEASTWTASSEDIAGLTAENPSLEKLGRMIEGLIPILARENEIGWGTAQGKEA